MKWGSKNIKTLQYGSKSIVAAYWGSKKIWDKKSEEILSYVDLGLPSGTLWGTCNLGTSNPYEFGDYYKFGALTPGEDGVECYELEIQNTDYDAAKSVLGKGWMIPTSVQCQELIDNCVWEISDLQDFWKVKSTVNDNYIIIPIYRPVSTFALEPGGGVVYVDSAIWCSNGASASNASTNARDGIALDIEKNYTGSIPPIIHYFYITEAMLFIRPVYQKVNIISFILLNKTYQAEDGMTFADWANSVYNIDGVNFIDEKTFICNDAYFSLEGGYDKNSIIIDGKSYFAMKP